MMHQHQAAQNSAGIQTLLDVRTPSPSLFHSSGLVVYAQSFQPVELTLPLDVGRERSLQNRPERYYGAS